MRCFVALLATLVLSHAASAATLTLDTDKQVYAVGETILLTLTLETDVLDRGFEAQVFVEVGWNGAVGKGAPFSEQTPLTGFGGGVVWVAPPSECTTDDRCPMFSQVAGDVGSLTLDAQEVSALLQVHTIAEGALALEIVPRAFFAFGLTPGDVVFTDNARNARVVPEPATAVLLMTGLSGLVVRRSRRR